MSLSPFNIYSELLKIILQLPSCISVAASYQIVIVPHLPSKLAATFGSVFKKGTFFCLVYRVLIILLNGQFPFNATLGSIICCSVHALI